ncbi:MAG: hypothetical protein WA666_03865 [Nitrospirota bacterium]
MAREKALTHGGEELGMAGTTVKGEIASSLRGLNEIEAEIVSLVRDTVSNKSG